MHTKPIKMQTQSENTVNIQDFQSLLQKNLVNEQLQIIDYTATKFLPIGENFGSSLVKIEVTLQKNNSSEKKTLHLVAKLMTDINQPILQWPIILKKEVLLYSEIAPVYKSLELEAGIDKNEVIDVFPKYFGHRYSISNDSAEVDENSILILENLNARGFYNGDKKKGLDLPHAKKALSALARFHAAGVALKRKRPDYFKQVVDRIRNPGINYDKLYENYDSTLMLMQKDAQFSKHLPKIETLFAAAKDKNYFHPVPQEPWATIAHGDFWVNNMMFHKDEQDNVDDVKFIDFQLSLYHSSLKDVTYFLFTAVNENVLAKHLDELMVFYYESLLTSLKRLHCDTTSFTRNNFDQEFKKLALNEFPFICIALSFFLFDISKVKDEKEIFADILESKNNDVFLERLSNIVTIYENKGWLDDH